MEQNFRIRLGFKIIIIEQTGYFHHFGVAFVPPEIEDTVKSKSWSFRFVPFIGKLIGDILRRYFDFMRLLKKIAFGVADE